MKACAGRACVARAPHAAAGQVVRAKLDAESEKQRVSVSSSGFKRPRVARCCAIYTYTCTYITRLQVNAARDERIKEIETQTQLELEAKDAEVAGLQARESGGLFSRNSTGIAL